ncbi:MAG: hypothetical protein A2270_06275 [Elusimicrobia bacterium RIFOXYA12_FULL_51_18]|nr:MAG: hypothetical protein A2270_06275 [Elusimicrobia bacterium RIFOXYA12_FULL_51_18]OGS31070.1 MAG: hypothetical protein A2218_01885 [Elusimicrobia bacterium RIFOXYA2_FULL_53_38]
MELLLILVPAVLVVLAVSFLIFHRAVGFGQLNSAAQRERMTARALEGLMRNFAVAENTIYRNNIKLNNMANKLQLSNNQLARLNNMKSKFLSMVVHDVRTPLSVIRGFSDLFARDPSANDKQRTMSKHMGSAVDRLNRLVSDLTDLAMIESGKLKIEPAVFNFCEVVDELMPAIEISAQTKGVVLKYDQIGRDAVIDGDKFRISQVLQNLMANAIKFTPGGGLVELKTRNDKCWIYVYVKDSGIGIHPSETRKIFEKFYQAEYQKDDKLTKLGWGLGLSIALEIISLHKGEIAAESRGLGHGSTFWFKLPIQPMAEQ